MSYVTTKAILDDVTTLIQDNSSTLRAKMLTWLNNIAQRVGLFPWNCLVKTSTLSISSNAITLPTDYVAVDNIVVGSYTFTDEDEVSNADSYLWASGGTVPVGYTVIGNTLTFKPATAAASCSLTYLQEVPIYTDGTSDTLFPLKFSPLFRRALLDQYYEYDADERIAGRIDVPLNLDLLRGLLLTEGVRVQDKFKKYVAAEGVASGTTS